MPSDDGHHHESAMEMAERAQQQTRDHARELSSLLRDTAEALMKSAALADEHAHQREQAGLPAAAAVERRAASRAREAADLARRNAEKWYEQSKV